KQAQIDLAWLQKNWFHAPAYVQVDGKPLFLSFGFDGLTHREWAEVFKGQEKLVTYLSERRGRPVASGVFDWPIPKDYPASLDRFYQQFAGQRLVMPVAFPRFHDICAEGKAQASLDRIADDKG